MSGSVETISEDFRVGEGMGDRGGASHLGIEGHFSTISITVTLRPRAWWLEV